MKIPFEIKFFLFSFLFFATHSEEIFANEKNYSYDYKIIRVIDGDTVEIEAPFLPKPLEPSLKLRVIGIDTPEKEARAKCEMEKQLAIEAKNFLTAKISSAKIIKIKLVKWDKYGGRILGDIFLDSALVSQLMIDSGYAKPYDGGIKSSWCN